MTNIVFLVDVDNTLLDNDSVIGLLEKNVASAIGPVRMRQFFDLYEEVRAEMDFVNFPEPLERFSRRCDDAGCVGALSHALYTFPFSELVYPGSFDALEHINKLGTSVVLTDGDQLFQRYKVRSTGIEATVDGRVLIYVHKENETDDIQKKFPADHYVIIDDKPRIHAAVKSKLGSRITTIMVRQGKYALEPDREYLPSPDIVLESIADLVSLSKQRILAAA